MKSGLVIVGASYAGVQAGISAREQGYQGPISIVADEEHLPYQRPPLSKAFLSGDATYASLFLRGDDYFRKQGIEMVLGRRAVGLDRDAKLVELQGGDRLPFDQLVIATGSGARRLSVPGHERDGIVYLRTLDDALHLKPRLEAASDVVIIGGGFIGLEVASTAAKAGKKVTLIEAQSRLLERAVSPLISQFLLDIHRSYGVDIRFNDSVVAVEGGDAVHEVVCGSGLRVRADLIVVGIGGIANDELAAQAGIACSNGIDVDEHGRTNMPDIYAAGDVSNHHNSFAGRRVRLEAVQNATDQGKAVGAMIAGKPDAYNAVPRFWSDQYNAKLQIVGLSLPTDSVAIRGRMDDNKFSVFYYRQGKLTAVDSINRPGDQIIARRLIGADLSPTPEQAADVSFDLKSLESA